jgi:hypothetical protein
MNYLSTFTLAFLFVSFIASAAVPTTGLFYFSYFTDDTCTTLSTIDTPNTKSYMASNVCWDYTPSTGSYNPTGYTSATGTLDVNVYTDAACTTANASPTGTIMCDGSCNSSPIDGTSYTCLYSDVPTNVTFTFASFTSTGCVTANASPTTSGTYTSANQCWPLPSTYSFFPTMWTSAGTTLTAYEFLQSSSCANFGVGNVSTPATTVSIMCDGACHTDIGSSSSYTCSYSNSAKLIFSLIVSFGIMLVLV